MKNGTVTIIINECANGFVVNGHINYTSYGPCNPCGPSNGNPTFVAADWNEAMKLAAKLKAHFQQTIEGK